MIQKITDARRLCSEDGWWGGGRGEENRRSISRNGGHSRNRLGFSLKKAQRTPNARMKG